MKKYELIKKDSILKYGVKLFRIRYLMNFGYIEKGTLGGYIMRN